MGHIGWGGRGRTCECESQSLVPYRLATPQDRQEQDTGIAGVLSFVGCGTYAMKNGVDEGTRTLDLQGHNLAL